MAKPSSGLVHRHTPNLEVYNARGMSVRQVAYLKADEQEPMQRLVTLTRRSANEQWRGQWDPRLFERLEQETDLAPSQQVTSALSGVTLLEESRDAGWRLTLHGEAGQATHAWDSRASHWQTEYDELLRPVLIRETAGGQPTRVAESFSYAREEGLNRRGRLVRHDDDAGSRMIDSYGLTGQELGETRHFLAALDLPDWPDAALEPGAGASTHWRYGPLDQVLEQTDAQGHRQCSGFTLGGELTRLTLHLNDGRQHPLLVETRYNAFGQVERQTLGNDVVRHAQYDPANGRLERMQASRPGRSQLQDLLYGYDPVGNVTRIEDLSQPVRHFANQRIDPVSNFVYDSLYRLTEASGREAVGAMIGPGLPELTPFPGDTSQLLNYGQQYHYDASGNLLSLRHVGQQDYTRSLNVAADSNRAVPAPGNPLEAFDGNGNLLQLAPGQPLQWNARNQLHSTRQVARTDGDDEEHYRYGGNRLRLRKVISRRVAGRQRRSETRYLPGLELHESEGERLAVITVDTGHGLIRCLHWSEGQPEGIANPQLRYSLDDLHDSSGLELDGDARIISHEGYYPFGGTAWWAAGSAIEASYKTRRYSGKERDSSGLYDYGLRYYAPWLMRWINPDPGGDVDGLNRYRFVRNNPLTLTDHFGLNPQDQHYSIKKFSKEPKEPGAERMLNGLGESGMSLLRGKGPIAEFAYNTNWSVREYLHLGASNQAGDIKRSDYEAATAGSHMRDLIGSQPLHRSRAEHSLAASTGFCDEFGIISVFLMASSADWPNVPIYSVKQPVHRSAILGDPRITDPLTVDPWVTYPVVHPWSQSHNSTGNVELSNFTPRMPGDPEYAIGYQQVDALREQHYQDLPVFDDDVMEARLDSWLATGKVWTQVSAMKDPQSVFYVLDGQQQNAAAIPSVQYDATYESLMHVARLRSNPRFAGRLRAF